MTRTKFARPKVNLFLHITGKRTDGYHVLESLVCFPSGGDRVSVTAGDRLSFTQTGPYAKNMGEAADNLVMKAALLLQQTYGTQNGAQIHLEKNLPVASGIGGGSSDAASVLHLLCDLWQLDVPLNDLCKLGQTLGADLPVCLHDGPALMSGIGEVITPVKSLPKLYILLVNPGVEVSTPAAFSKLTRIGGSPDAGSFDDLSCTDFIDRLKICRNDLQKGAIELVPQIGQALDALQSNDDCLLARMSGSGATCFGLYESLEAAEAAGTEIASHHQNWWVDASLMQVTL